MPAELAEGSVIEPAPFVMRRVAPAVRVVRVKPDPLPISNAPLDGVVVKPVPPLATGKVPVTPVLKGNPVALVKVPEAGVPKTGAVMVGEVNVAETNVGDTI